MFSEENNDSSPNLSVSPHPTMPTLVVQQGSVVKLLRNLQPNKAAGPDKLSTRFLKEVTKDLSPLYIGLFQKCIDEGYMYVPREWRATEVSFIFKKGAKYIRSMVRSRTIQIYT